MITLLTITWGIISTVAAVVWKISQYAFKRQVETLKSQNETLKSQNDYLKDKVGSVDLIEKFYKTQHETIKSEYEKALLEKDEQKIKDLKALQDQNSDLQKQTENLKSKIKSYEQKIDKVSETNYATGTPVKTLTKNLSLLESLLEAQRKIQKNPSLLEGLLEEHRKTQEDFQKKISALNVTSLMGRCSKCGKLKSKNQLLNLGGVCANCYSKK